MKDDKRKEDKETRNKKQETNDSQTVTDSNPQADGESREERIEIKEVIKEINTDYKDKWLRAQADYQNLARETETRRAEWVRYSEQQILEEFIPIFDNFKKAFGHDTDMRINADVADNADSVKNFENWKKGIEYIMKQFEAVLKNHGVEEIKTIGEQFNPARHETMGEEESGEFSEGKIIREIEAGYEMRGRVIKVAKVILAKVK